ncbi:MAG TPA: ACP S-malonyltransferase [Smithellaceae bacterium]|nr:ACP S-malonyltransferase [Smithellaceae bacterium]
MAKLALVFPGQGTQHTGMGSSLFAEFASVRDAFERAGSVLGVDMRRLCFEGSQEELNLTVNTQIAVLTLNIALYGVFKEKTAINPAVLAGHSLGEYAALYASGAVAFDDVFRLVQARAVYHQEAVSLGAGAMAAIIGMDDEAVESICAEVNNPRELVAVAIHNAPAQVVVSGHTGAVEKVMRAAKQKGAMTTVRLPISVPCHCRLLQSAADRFAEKLADIGFHDFTAPVIPNCDPEVFYTRENARELLCRQIVSPVKWRQTVEKMAALGVETIVEIGPKRTLCGLIKRISKKMQLYSVEDVASLYKTAEALAV